MLVKFFAAFNPLTNIFRAAIARKTRVNDLRRALLCGFDDIAIRAAVRILYKSLLVGVVFKDLRIYEDALVTSGALFRINPGCHVFAGGRLRSRRD